MASALGLALAVGGGVAAARVATDTPPPDRVATSRQPPSGPPPVAPAVRFETADPPRSSRTTPAAHVNVGTPRRLVVPRLGVDAPVVGIDASGGRLVPPDDPQIVGWWSAGAVPGAARGSALVTGHTVSAGGGALDHLETLRPGDPVTVRTTGGAVHYDVTDVAVYRKATLARDAARLFSQEVPGRLVLITCEDWNGAAYLSNVVVTAEPTT